MDTSKVKQVAGFLALASLASMSGAIYLSYIGSNLWAVISLAVFTTIYPLTLTVLILAGLKEKKEQLEKNPFQSMNKMMQKMNMEDN